MKRYQQAIASSVVRPGVSLLVAFLVCALLLPIANLHAQKTQFTIDTNSSLAWWQMNPHLGHLWATTCPEDPTWQGGSGTTYTEADAKAGKKPPPVAMIMEKENQVPLYPRLAVTPVCTQGVRGEIQVDDKASWRGVKGLIAINAKTLKVALDMRNRFTQNVMEVDRYPEIRFSIVDLADVQPGDTLRANAVGTLYLHGVAQQMKIPIKAWQEAGGIRVTGQTRIDATDLVETYQMSKWKLGLGVGTNIWKHLYMGLDVVLREGPASGSSGTGS